MITDTDVLPTRTERRAHELYTAQLQAADSVRRAREDLATAERWLTQAGRRFQNFARRAGLDQSVNHR